MRYRLGREGMEDPISTRRALENLWMQRVNSAQVRYRDAKAETASVQIKHAELLTPAPDGTFALGRALTAENAALREYCRVMTIFTDLLVHGKMPDEPK